MKTYNLHPESVRTLFNNIASTYDFLNHFLSMGRDIYWRKKAVRELEGLEGWILDLATGTGDVAIEIIHQNGHPSNQRVFGLDFSEPMLRNAREKILKKGLSRKIAISLGDALSLPFRDNTFHAVLIAFGLRNIVRKEQALSEMIRVVKKGGKIIILEFIFPEKGFMKKLYPVYFRKILPRLGGLISGDPGAYRYLPDSVSPFPSAENYKEIARKAGMIQVVSHPLTGGVVSIVSGIKGDE